MNCALYNFTILRRTYPSSSRITVLHRPATAETAVRLRARVIFFSNLLIRVLQWGNGKKQRCYGLRMRINKQRTRSRRTRENLDLRGEKNIERLDLLFLWAFPCIDVFSVSIIAFMENSKLSKTVKMATFYSIKSQYVRTGLAHRAAYVVGLDYTHEKMPNSPRT